MGVVADAPGCCLGCEDCFGQRIGCHQTPCRCPSRRKPSVTELSIVDQLLRVATEIHGSRAGVLAEAAAGVIQAQRDTIMLLSSELEAMETKLDEAVVVVDDCLGAVRQLGTTVETQQGTIEYQQSLILSLQAELAASYVKPRR